MSILQEKYGFIYIWFDKHRSRYYVGCHWGTEDDGYICSSKWMREAKKRRPNDFKRRVITRIYTTRQELLEIENKYLSLIKDEELGIKYYNLTKHMNGHWSSDPDKLLTVGQKVSKANKGRTVWNKGKSPSEETKQKIKESLKGRKLSEETLAKRKGRKLSEETKQKMREAKLGVPKSEEHRQKMCERKLSDNHKKVLIESRLGSKHSEESKKKMSDSLKGKTPWNKVMNLPLP